MYTYIDKALFYKLVCTYSGYYLAKSIGSDEPTTHTLTFTALIVLLARTSSTWTGWIILNAGVPLSDEDKGPFIETLEQFCHEADIDI